MEYIAAIVVIIFWGVFPNLALAIVTLNKASEDSHIAFSAAAFIPWALFGLSLLN